MKLTPPSCGTDQAVSGQAEPEVDQHAEVRLEGVVTSRGRERRDEKKVRHVPQNDRAECLNEVDEHRLFRHRKASMSCRPASPGRNLSSCPPLFHRGSAYPFPWRGVSGRSEVDRPTGFPRCARLRATACSCYHSSEPLSEKPAHG